MCEYIKKKFALKDLRIKQECCKGAVIYYKNKCSMSFFCGWERFALGGIYRIIYVIEYALGSTLVWQKMDRRVR